MRTALVWVALAFLSGCANFDNRRKVIVRTPDGKTVRVYADTLEQKRKLNAEVEKMRKETADVVFRADGRK